MTCMPYLKPSSILQCLLANDPYLLLGGLDPGQDATEMLRTFWANYKRVHPEHEVFEMNVPLEDTIPVILHGDAGRSLKKQKLEIVSLLPVLGLDTDKNTMTCTCPEQVQYRGKRKRDPLAQRLNSRNSSFLTHFLLFAFVPSRHKETPGLLMSMLSAVSTDLGEVCRQGILVGGKRWFVACVGMRADAEWQTLVGVLERSYRNVGHKNFLACCHLCEAGVVGVPFEDSRSGAVWKQTIGRSCPWSSPPPFSPIPFRNWMSGAASMFFQSDPLHVFRLGIARNFIGSTIVLLAIDGFWDYPGVSKAFPQRMIRAWGAFQLWCAASKKFPASVRSFSMQKLHMVNMSSFPFLGCKGSDTIIFLKWLQFCGRLRMVDGGHVPSYLDWVIQACTSGLAFQAIHHHGLWLPFSCRTNLANHVKIFLHCYSKLANHCLGRNLQLYSLVPKYHGYDHIKHNMEVVVREHLGINPGLWDCSMSEDFIGRISRQSRRVSTSSTTLTMSS